MSAPILVPCAPGSAEWLDARKGVVTASRFGDARAKLSRNSGAKAKGDPTEASDRYARLLAVERISGQHLDDTFKTWQMERGNELEPLARAAYEASTGNMVQEGGFVMTADRRFGYSTDGRVFGEPGGVEIKTPAACDKIANAWLDVSEVLDEYMDQVQGGIWIEGWEWLDLVIYTPWLRSVGKEVFIKRIRRDEEYIDSLATDLLAFAARVDAVEAALRDPLTNGDTLAAGLAASLTKGQPS